jgi:hypothetical protein
VTSSPGGRKSFYGKESQQEEQEDQTEDRIENLKRQMDNLKGSNEELNRIIRADKSTIETKDVFINALQHTLTSMKQKLETLEIEASRNKFENLDPSFESMIKSIPTVAPVPAVSEPVSAVNLDEDVWLQAYVQLKTAISYRDAADQEFLMRWSKIQGLLEASRISQVEKDLLAKGEKNISINDLKTLSGLKFLYVHFCCFKFCTFRIASRRL